MAKILGKSDRTLRDSRVDVGVVMALIAALLLLRDAFGVEVNKYIFLLIVGVATFTFPIDKVLYLTSFLMPLYVGVPGNYMTVLLFIRMFSEVRGTKINTTNMLFCILAGGYSLLHAVAFNKMDIPCLIFFPSMLLVVMIYSLKVNYSKKELVLFYALGTAALGLIMLISTLQVYDFKEILNSAQRLGTANAAFAGEDAMTTSMDPNFYGMFTIAALSLGMEVLESTKDQLTNQKKLLLIIAMLCCLMVALIGLSRSFFLVLIVWALLYALSRKKMKSLLVFILIVALAIGILSRFMSNVVSTIFERWDGSDVVEGNGRFKLLREFYDGWRENLWGTLFGTSIFDCNVHITPLQVVFGGGLVFLFLFGGFIITLKNNTIRTNRAPLVRKWLPMMGTLAMSLTVPALLLINTMYPFAIVGLYDIEGD